MRVGELRSAKRRSSFRGITLIFLLVVLGALTAASLAAGQGSDVSDVTYTLDGDFDKGRLVNVNHSAPGSNQLQLNAESSTFPFIWIALSGRGTIAKIDTRDGTILGEFSTTSDGDGSNDPSRTTVNLDGSAWAGNRSQSSVVHVGLKEANQCVDRNGNGTIDTSSGYGDVKPWPGGSSGATAPVSAAEDECILHYVDTSNLGGDARHVSANADGNIWVGANNGQHVFQLVNGQTGAITRTEGPFACGGYGGLIDGAGVIWSATSGSAVLRFDPNAPLNATNPKCIPMNNYGLALDSTGHVWASTLGGGTVSKIAPDGTIVATYNQGVPSAQGLAIDSNDHVWISSSLFCGGGCTVAHLKPNGDLVGNVTGVGNGPTGVAVDAAGKIWTANINSSNASRIDPTGGGFGPDGVTRIGAVDLTVGLPGASPYNYSDMTGAALLSNTAPQGNWTVVQDGGAAGTQWSKIVWNTEAQGSMPAGSEIVVEARAADTQAALGSQAFSAVTNSGALSLTGRYIEVRVTLRPSSDGASPVLSDIRVCEVGGCQAAATTPTVESPAAQRRRPAARVAGVPRSCVRGSFNARVRIRASGELRSVRVTLNGRRVMSTKRKSFSVRIPGRTMRSGRHRLRVVATDSLGRTIRINRTFRRCARPAQQRELPTFTG